MRLLICWLMFTTAMADDKEKKVLLEVEIPPSVVTQVESIAETAIESALQPPQLKALKMVQDWVCEDGTNRCEPKPEVKKKKIQRVQVFKENKTCKEWGVAGLCNMLGITGELVREYDKEIE